MALIEPSGQDWSQYTLVDIVNKIWSLGSNAIGKIKDATHAALNAIKDGLEFISNAVLAFVLNSIAELTNLGITSMFSLISTLIPSFSVGTQGSLPVLQNSRGNFILGLNAITGGLDFQLNQNTIRFSNIFSDVQVETLAIGEIFNGDLVKFSTEILKQLILPEAFVMILPLIWNIFISNPWLAGGIQFAGLFASGLTKYKLSNDLLNQPTNNFSGDQKKLIFQILASFHFGQFISSLLDLVLSAKGMRVSTKVGILISFLTGLTPIFSELYTWVSGENSIQLSMGETMLINALSAIIGTYQLEMILNPISSLAKVKDIFFNSGSPSQSKFIDSFESTAINLAETDPTALHSYLSTQQNMYVNAKLNEEVEYNNQVSHSQSKIKFATRAKFGMILVVYHLAMTLMYMYQSAGVQ